MIVFVFSGKGIGGAPILILRWIHNLYKEGVPCKVIGHVGSYLNEELSKTKLNVEFIDILNLKRNNTITSNDVLVCFSFESFLYPLISKSPRILYYNIMVDFPVKINLYKFGLNFKKLTKKLILKMHGEDSFYFMDGAGTDYLKKKLRIEIPTPKYIPIIVDSIDKILYNPNREKFYQKIRITYIGRSEKWKILPFKKILSDIIKFSAKASLHFEISVICDNKNIYINTLRDILKNSPSNVSINFYENVDKDSLINFLLENADLHFAMGTACLDGAKVGIPSILMDFSYNDILDNYRYKWIFETKKFSLGTYIDNKESYDGLTMEQVLLLYIHNDSYLDKISKECYQYVINNHSEGVIINKLITATRIAKSNFSDISKYIVYYSKVHQYLKYLGTNNDSK